jgi:DNA/RNA-binding domain of Phe-tRNA-synthetase-like protein
MTKMRIAGADARLDRHALQLETGTHIMSLLDYKIDRSIFMAHPGYQRGLVVVRGAANDVEAPRLREMLRAEEERLRDRLQDCLRAGNITGHPVIAAWREAYRKFGARPSEHRSSIEAMARRVVKPDSLPSINPLVDIGNIVSLRYMLPAGAHPLPLSDGPLELRPAVAGDVFLPADGGVAETPPPGEVVFCQGHDVLTRRWTWRQAAGTQTLPDSSDVFFNVDGLPPTTGDEVLRAMRDIGQLAAEFTGGVVALSAVLTVDQVELRVPWSQALQGLVRGA